MGSPSLVTTNWGAERRRWRSGRGGEERESEVRRMTERLTD